jgi:hypothetical protein
METILPSICLEHGKVIEEILGKNRWALNGGGLPPLPAKDFKKIAQFLAYFSDIMVIRAY